MLQVKEIHTNIDTVMLVTVDGLIISVQRGHKTSSVSVRRVEDVGELMYPSHILKVEELPVQGEQKEFS